MVHARQEYYSEPLVSWQQNWSAIAQFPFIYVCIYFALLMSRSDGVGRSGTFCALTISLNQFKAEQKVDIFQIIKIMRTQRPGSVANSVSYSILAISIFTCINTGSV